MSDFATRLIHWQRQHGRHGLPWQSADAYRVWLSEIMLQQTQVSTVIPYYQRFVARFPGIAALAAASEDEVLAHWSGLGYYARGRNLHRAAQIVAEEHYGEFPHEFAQILELPGIGRSTAAAISVFAFQKRCAILDGNVKRVLARYFAIAGFIGEKKIEICLWQQADALLPHCDVATYTQGLMDLGATVCTRSKANCGTCPVREDCKAYQSGRAAQFSAPHSRKALPEKCGTFLLVVHGDDILLEKRPGNGIWGGLWCLPHLDDAQEAVVCCTRKFGVDVVQALALPDFVHTFTHFKLRITPLLVRLIQKPSQAQEPGEVWLNMEEALRAAIPAPVRKLLQELRVAQQMPA